MLEKKDLCYIYINLFILLPLYNYCDT